MSIDMNKVLAYVEAEGKAIAEDRQAAAQIRADAIDEGTWPSKSDAGSVGGKTNDSSQKLFERVLDRLTVKDSNERSWLNKDPLGGYADASDVWKTILASFTDVQEDLLTGAAGIVEGVADAGAMIAPVLLGTDKEKATEFVAKDSIDEQGVVRELLSNLKGLQQNIFAQIDGKGYVSDEELKNAEGLMKEYRQYMDERMEDESIVGDKLDSLAQSTGQMLATSAGSMVGVPWWLITGATAGAGEAESALKEGATYEQALDSGIISGAAEVLSEKLFSGIKFGGKALDDALVTALSRGVSNKFARNALKLGLDVTGEGLEEVVTSLASEFGQWLTYRNDESLKEIVFSEQALDEKIEAFFSGALMGGGSSASNMVTSKFSGVDATSGLSANEEKVINKLYKDRVAEAEKDGKITAKEKSKIYDEVVEAMDKGEISTEDIEDIVGGDSYREYKKAMDNQEDNAFLREYDELGSKRGATPKENAQYSEMTERAKQINENRKNLRSRLSREVSEMVKGERLSESYRQKALRGVAFKADLTKVDEKQRAIYQKAMDSGVVNDSRRSHEFVDLVAKIAADKGVDFDFTNNERLKQSGFAVEGASVNGYVTENGVTINMQSAKALNKVVGHEVTHVLEGTELYDALQKVAFDFAEAKGELTDRWKATKALYKDLDSQEINKEITADLVGDYLFGDSDFIGQLYAGHRSTFEKIYDEIKYLCKVVTAGSKEARQLEKVKKAFADAYRVEKSTAESGAKYSISETTDGRFVAVVDNDILKDIDASNWDKETKKAAKKAANDALKKFSSGIEVRDVTIDVNKISRDEYTRSKYSEALARKNPDAYGDKMRAADNIDDVIHAATNWTADGELKHDRSDFVDFAHGKTLIMSGTRTYSADVVVGIRENGDAVFYDVVDILPEKFEVKEKEPSTAVESNNSNNAIQEGSDESILPHAGSMSSGNPEKVQEKLQKIDLDLDTETDTVSFSLSSLEETFNVSNTDYLLNNTDDTGFVQARQEYVDALASSIAVNKGKPTKEEREKAERYMDSLFLIHDLILDDRDRLDYEAAVDRSAWVSNAEYGGSIDFSTLCAKRRLFTGTFDAIQNALPDTVLDENDFLQIRNMLLESDQESPCSMCYVEGSRAKHGVYVQKWLKEYLKTNPEWKPQIADFTSTTRLEQTRIQHPEAYAAYQAAMNKLSQRKPKEASVRTDYKGEILRDFKDASNVEEKNKNGGVRFNSFSDFEVIHALVCMQVLTDMSRVGLNGQAYTKVKEFAECFGNTGLKINLSLVAKDVDANGKLIMDETNGMNYNEAMDLRDRYSDNVGTVIVVFNEAQLKAALADPSIDYVLPFHRSQWKKSQYTMMGLPAQTKDFTNFQNDRIKNPKTGRDVKLTKIKHTSTFTNDQTGETFEIKDNIMPNQYWDFDKSGRENAETYLKYINNNGMTPKFSFLLSKDASGKWVLPDDAVGDGYFKLLIDFKMYNNDGWGSPQNPVVPDFNMDYIQQMLADYKGGHSAFPVANDVVDKFVKSKKAKRSLSDASKPIGPVRGGYNITSEETYLDTSNASVTDTAPNAPTESAISVPVNLSPKDRSKKFFFDEVMSLDKMPEEFRKRHGQKWVEIQRATENAQNLVVYGADGVKPLNDIFQRVVDTGAFGEFERYMQHQLNMDAMSLNQRFGLKNKDVIGGVTAEMSRQEAATLEKAHPEFKELAQEIYDYNRFLRNVLVQSGKITQETADLWEQRYPHYIPVKRAGFGNDYEVSELLGFMIENMEQTPDAENMDGFFQRVEETAPLKERKGSDLPIQPLFDTLTERAMQTYWAAAMNGADMRAFAPVRSDVQKQATPAGTKVAPQIVQIETEKSIDPKILDVENEIMRKGRMNPIKWMEEFFVDNGMVFERLAKKTKDRGLEAKWNFVRNARGAAQHLIGNGDQAKGVKPLKEIFAAVEKTGAVEQFYEYLGHQRNLDGMSMRVRFGIPANQTMMGRSAAESIDAIFKMNEEHPEFKALAEETYKYSDNLLNMMVENGMITQSDADMVREIAPHWIPFNTVEGKIQPVFTTLAQETLKIQNQMALNKFGVHLKNTLGTVVSENPMSIREFMNSIEKGGNLVHFGGNARYHTMTVLDNGKAVTFEITDEMYTALKPTRDILSTSIPVLSHASTLRRNLITAYSPWFTAKNAIRDIQEVVVNSQHPVKTYAAIPQAIKEIRQKGAFYQEYVKNGGEQNTYFDTDSAEFGSGKGIMNALETKTGLSRILKANNFVEMVPRFAEYIASREAGASVEVAMLDAARVTTNFAAGGKVTKFLNRNGATFLNASVQGFVQQARNFAEAKQNGFKGWGSLAARYAALGLPVVLLNNLIWDDDEDYQKLPDYITNNYYIVWKYGEGSFVRLPKGRTAAVIQNAIKQASADKADWKEFWNVLGENLAPNNPLEDNIFAPVIQVAMNKTWYNEDLVPNRLQKIDDVTQRFDEKTSRWAVELSKRIEDSWLGDHVDLSPKQIHYLMDQYSGVLGDTILPFTTPKAESPTDAGNLIAPVRDIFTTNSVLNDRVTGYFYETLEAVQSEAETPGSSRSVKLQNEILSNYNFRINELLQQQRDIQNSDLKDSEKYKQNLELKKQINALQEEALAQYQNIRITGKYAEAADKRYNYSFNKNTGLNEWFEIRPKDADGSDNWFYQMEQGATKAFGISPAEYWNNQEEYAAAYWAAKHYDDSYFETVKNVLGIDDFARYADGMTKIYADKDKNGNSISGSRKRKMKDYVYGLNIPEIEKHIVFKAEYNYNKQHDHEIRKYLDSLDLSPGELRDVLDELGMR